MRCYVGLAIQETGDVRFRMRVKFDNGTVESGHLLNMTKQADDTFMAYESRKKVPPTVDPV